jgi:aminoglycoside phosphotransferase (APT) family kinase protein
MPAETAAAIAAAYDLGPLTGAPVAAARGEQGVIWRLDTASGRWAVKQLLRPVEEADAARDVAFQRAALAAAVPLPAPRLTTAGTVLLAAGPTRWHSAVRVYRWAELADEPPVSAAELGRLLAGLHQLAWRDQGPPSDDPWFSAPSGRAGLARLLAAASEAGESWAPLLGRRLAGLIEAERVISPPAPALLLTCHRDLNLENVRRGAGGGLVVLDWENSGPAEPARELAAVVADLAADLGAQAAGAAHAAYLAAGGQARLTGPADFGMAVAVQGHLLQVYGYRALAAAESEENRARSRWRLQRMLEQPLTLQVIGSLLDLASS